MANNDSLLLVIILFTIAFIRTRTFAAVTSVIGEEISAFSGLYVTPLYTSHPVFIHLRFQKEEMLAHTSRIFLQIVPILLYGRQSCIERAAYVYMLGI